MTSAGLFRRLWLVLSASALLSGGSGCFLFTYPGPSADEIAMAHPVDPRYYHLRDDDRFCGMRFFLPGLMSTRPRPAVVIFPGGSYGVLALEREGEEIAAFLNRYGVAGIVVKYPLGSLLGHFRRHPDMLEAALRAVRLTRFYAPQLGIDPKRIGVAGFSAGGHLAGLVATSSGAGDPGASDPADRVSGRPDFAVLCYPVVSMIAPCTHKLSRSNLLGSAPDDATMRELSVERRIDADCPPVFLWLFSEDSTVDPENGRLLAAALRDKGVPHRVRIYPGGSHGMGLLSEREAAIFPEAAQWPVEMLTFMREYGFLDYSGELSR